jgi:hypothetical protein
MPCFPGPVVPFPTLPAPLSLSPPAVPDVPQPPGLCCKLPPLTTPPIPIPIPAQILTPLITTLNGFVAVVKAYLLLKPIKCPLE